MPFTRPTANSVRIDAGGRLLRTDNKCRAEHYCVLNRDPWGCSSQYAEFGEHFR